MTYGCEAWFLTPKFMAKLNRANIKMLARIMGSSIQEEVRSATSHFDLVVVYQVKEVRARRLKWAGDILRMDPDRLLHKKIEAQLVMGMQGGLWSADGRSSGHDTE